MIERLGMMPIDFSDPSQWSVRKGRMILSECRLVGHLVSADDILRFVENAKSRGDPIPVVVELTPTELGYDETDDHKLIVGYCRNPRSEWFAGNRAMVVDIWLHPQRSKFYDDRPLVSAEVFNNCMVSEVSKIK
jgi:hypothetical protein